MSVITNGIHVVRNTGLAYLLGNSEVFGDMDSDVLSDIVHFKEMDVAFVHVFFDPSNLPDKNDFTFQILVSNLNDPDSFVTFTDPTVVQVGCNGIGWNIQEFGFAYARVKYSKESVTSGKMKITVRAKKG